MIRSTLWLLLLAACAEAPAPVDVVRTKAGDEMVRIPGGEFVMGSSSGDSDEAPEHRVRVQGFLIDRYEVRQSMFARLELSNPSRTKGADLPVDNLTWVQAVRFCNERSLAEGLQPCYGDDGRCDFTKSGYRLPTEAEWEYACRGGQRAAYCFGSDARRLREFAWFSENSAKKTHAVGSKKPNAWGLFDMHGNVAEWCNDPYAAGYYAKSPASDPPGPDDGELFVVRGGAYRSSAKALRSAARGRDRPGFGDACLAPDTLGMRCVRRETN